MSFYANMALLAASLLAKFGAPATLTSNSHTINKQTNKMETASAVSTQCRAVVRPVEITDEDGREVTYTQAVLNVEPVEGGKLTLSSDTYNIGKVTVVKPIGSPIIYFAEVS